MSKINQIENAILKLEGGKFQKLVDQYLYRKYKFSNIQSLGSQQGTDKPTKGVPDSYVRTFDGKYIAIMYGTYTKEAAKFVKVKSDIISCLERVKNEDLTEIICCHTSSNFTIEQDKELCSLFDNVTLIGINTLSNDLLYHYPMLAEDYLSVQIDTKQILSPEDFIVDNNKSAFGTPLDINLVGRDEEFNELIQKIQENEVVIVEGPSGVGKTKLAYECCKCFCDKNGYKPYIIKNRNLSIYDDLKSYFSEDNKYLILVDDANKLTDLEFVLELIKENTEEKKFKIVLTVRDYAKKDTVSKVRDYVAPYEYKLATLGKDIITEIVSSNLGIKNQVFLDQISDISKGNVRLAFMAGISAKQDGFFANIQNSADIFSKYFNYIFKDLNENELTVMAITAFIESFEIQNNESLVYKLAKIAGLTNDFVIDTCKKLHDLEVVDVYEDLAVKFSDQNLRDYIIYHIFFESKTIKLDELISLTFPNNSEKVIYHLNTTMQLFYSDDSLAYLKSSVKKIWQTVISNNELAYRFAESFHNLIEDEVLFFIKTEISNIEYKQIDMLNYHFKSKNSLHNNKILNILTGYKYSDNLDSAIELFVQYVNKNTSDPENIRHHLIEGYGIDTESHKYDYATEYSILNTLFHKFIDTQNDTIAVLCMIYASSCLKYSFETSESSYKSHTFNIVSFSIPNSEGIKKLHGLAIEILCDFYSKNNYKEFSYNELINYRPQGIHNQCGVDELIPIMESDSQKLELNLKSIINVLDIVDCKMIYHLDKWFKANDVKVSSFFSSWETNKHFKLIKKLQKFSYADEDTTREAADNRILNELKREIYSMTPVEIEELLLSASKLKFDNEWYFYNRWSKIVCDCDEDKLYSFVNLTIKYTPNNYFAHSIIKKMTTVYGYDKTYSIINSYDITQIVNWYRELISLIPDDRIDLEFCNQILNGIRDNNILYRIPFETAERVNRKHPVFMQAYVNEIINVYDSKKESHQLASNFLNRGLIFNEDNIDNFLCMFKSFEQLIKMYIYASKEERYFDYQNVLFAAILKNDISIINAIIDLYYENTSNYEDLKHLEVIWDCDNYLDLFEYIINYIIQHDAYGFVVDNCLENVIETLYSQQEKLMESIFYVIGKNDDEEFIEHILKASEGLSKEHRFDLTLLVCKTNNSIEMFKKCPIGQYPKHGWSGSTVPVLENRLKEFEEISDKLNGVDYIEHRVLCADCIERLREIIKETISKEFIYDY